MAMVAHLHHCCNAATCPSSIHTVRWHDRLLQCPRCQHLNVGPWDADQVQPGLQRSRCQAQRAASAPAMTSRGRSWMAASAR